MIAELGLRFRPAAQADLEAHAGRLALLVRDLADQPVDMLEIAVEKWAKSSRFMPTCAELIALIDAERDRRARLREPEAPPIVRVRLRALPNDRRLTPLEIDKLREGDAEERALFDAGKASGRFVLRHGSHFEDTSEPINRLRSRP